MPKLDLDAIRQTNATGYPAPFNQQVKGRWYRRLAPAAGLTMLGASHVVLRPGAWSSQRHWHELEDELLIMLEGEAVLVEDDCETLLKAGDMAAWPKDVANAHHLVNRSGRPCTFICIDNRRDEGDCHYPDIDLHYVAGTGKFTHKDGTAY